MSSQRDTCASTVELTTLAPGMAKQYEQYQDALQELVDNAVAATVTDERYFENPDDPVEIAISITRTAETVRTVVADTGPGIDRDSLATEVFRTGNKSVSSGILNNVGWGLKASLAWFERTLAESTDQGVTGETAFTLRTQRHGGSHERVSGPVTGELPITTLDDGWGLGDDHDALSFTKTDHGTCVAVSCARSRFDDDVWASAESLATKVQYLRERFGVLFRRLLAAHDETRIEIRYHDVEPDAHGVTEVVPIFPTYAANTPEEGGVDAVEYTQTTFTVGGDDTPAFEVEYESGTLDFDAMTERFADETPELLTASNRFRYRYRPSQNRQGIDVYANGRVLMTSVFSELFDLTRNNQYNYFGGTLRIRPVDPDGEVPTDNNKTRIDANSSMWQAIREQLMTPEFRPQGRDYGSRGVPSKDRPDSSNSTSTDIESDSGPTAPTLTSPAEVFDLHQGDARDLRDHLESLEADTGASLIGNTELVITSPPYFDIKDYGYEAGEQIGRGDRYDAYLDELRSVFDATYDVTSETASLWVVVNTIRQRKRVFDLPSDIARICQTLNPEVACPRCGREGFDARGDVAPVRGDPLKCPDCSCRFHARPDSWHLEDIIIWNKTRARPFSKKGKLRNVFEYILCFSKSGDFTLDTDAIRVANPAEFKKWWVDYPERYHPQGKLPENIWEIAPPNQGAFAASAPTHPAPFPPELVERICAMTTDPGDIVLDPFAGSGTVIAQANAMDRRGLGLELSTQFYDAFPETVAAIQGREETKIEENISRQDLTRLITALRQVKLTMELLRTVADRRGLDSPSQLDVHTAFHVSTQLNYQCVDERTHGSGEVYLVTDELSQRERRALEDDVLNALGSQPCTGFGIQLNPVIDTTSEFVERHDSGNFPALDDCRYLYTEGRHYAFNDRVTFDDWQSWVTERDEWQQGLGAAADPPVVSNLGCDATHPEYTLETMDRETASDHEVRMVHRGREQTIVQLPNTR